MRIDQKYFTLFVTICGVATLAVIIFGTIRYVERQESRLRENLAGLEAEEIRFPALEGGEEIIPVELGGRKVLVAFWATWSEKSLDDLKQLGELAGKRNWVVLAASVRDDPEQVKEYSRRNSFGVIWVDGTEFYNSMQVPGIPSYLLIGSDGRIEDLQIGEGIAALSLKMEGTPDHDAP